MSFIPQDLDEKSLKAATKAMSLEVIKLAMALPRNPSADVLGRQLIRSATSVAANYRAACRARSRAEMISKLGTVEEESDETCLWLEMIQEANHCSSPMAAKLHREYDRMTAITVASRKTLRSGPSS